MKRWQRVRYVLRRTSAVAIAAAGPLAIINPIAGAIVGLVGAVAGTLQYDLPRDVWTPAERAANTRKQQPATRDVDFEDVTPEKKRPPP